MRSKAPLALMEQLIMVLVFALAAALCLQMFALSDRISREKEDQDRMVLLAQNAAEVIKHAGGDMLHVEQALIAHFGGQVQQQLWCVCCDENLNETTGETAVYRLYAQGQPSDTEGLNQALVWVTNSRHELFTLTVCWQGEVAGNG